MQNTRRVFRWRLPFQQPYHCYPALYIRSNFARSWSDEENDSAAINIFKLTYSHMPIELTQRCTLILYLL